MTQTCANRIIEMKTRFLTVLVGAAFCLTLASDSRASEPSASAKLYWNNFLTDALNDQALDVRDARNRPVASRSARTAFKDLLTLNVFRFAENENATGLSQIRKILAEAINPLAQKIRAAAAHVWEMAERFAAFTFKKMIRPVRVVQAGIAPPSGASAVSDPGLQISYLAVQSNLPLRC